MFASKRYKWCVQKLRGRYQHQHQIKTKCCVQNRLCRSKILALSKCYYKFTTNTMGNAKPYYVNAKSAHQSHDKTQVIPEIVLYSVFTKMDLSWVHRFTFVAGSKMPVSHTV